MSKVLSAKEKAITALTVDTLGLPVSTRFTMMGGLLRPIDPFLKFGEKYVAHPSQLGGSEFTSEWCAILRGIEYLVNPSTPYNHLDGSSFEAATNVYYCGAAIATKIQGIKIVLPPTVSFSDQSGFTSTTQLRLSSYGQTVAFNIWKPPLLDDFGQLPTEDGNSINFNLSLVTQAGNEYCFPISMHIQ